MRNLTLKKRIIVCFAVLILLFLAISVYSTYFIRTDQVIDSISKAKMLAKMLTYPSCEWISLGRFDSLRANISLLKDSFFSKELLLLNIYNENKKLLTSFTDEGIKSEDFKRIISQKGKIKILNGKNAIYNFLPIEFKGYTCGFILVAFSKSKVEEDIRKISLWAFGVFLFLLLICFVVYFQMTRFLFNPLNALNDGIDKINKGNYNVSIPVVTNDEVGRVVSAFNGMTEAIKVKIETIENMNLELKKMYDKAIHDGLTGLYNHSFFNIKLQEYIENKKSFGIVLMDIDFFKKVNDTYGHLVGDFVLKKFAEEVSLELSNDFFARYGGEEFVVILEKQNLKEIADRIRKKIENLPMKYNGINLSVTVSCGCAEFPDDGKTSSELIESADKALYHAKRSGRNRVVCFKETVEYGSNG